MLLLLFLLLIACTVGRRSGHPCNSRRCRNPRRPVNIRAMDRHQLIRYIERFSRFPRLAALNRLPKVLEGEAPPISYTSILQQPVPEEEINDESDIQLLHNDFFFPNERPTDPGLTILEPNDEGLLLPDQDFTTTPAPVDNVIIIDEPDQTVPEIDLAPAEEVERPVDNITIIDEPDQTVPETVLAPDEEVESPVDNVIIIDEPDQTVPQTVLTPAEVESPQNKTDEGLRPTPPSQFVTPPTIPTFPVYQDNSNEQRPVDQELPTQPVLLPEVDFSQETSQILPSEEISDQTSTEILEPDVSKEVETNVSDSIRDESTTTTTPMAQEESEETTPKPVPNDPPQTDSTTEVPIVKPDPIILSEKNLTDIANHTLGNGAFLDFSDAERNKDGLLCMTKTHPIEQVVREPYLDCVHKTKKKCHYSYVTVFETNTEEVCDEHFIKQCHILFVKRAMKSVKRKCYRPLTKVCDGTGPETCQRFYETGCETVYKGNGSLPQTSCMKYPVDLCGKGCTVKADPEVCHDKVFDSIDEIPEEHCDLSPTRVCKNVAKLVPRLKPESKCSSVPQESCQYRFGDPKKITKEQKSIWCLEN